MSDAPAAPHYDLDVSVVIPALEMTPDFAKWMTLLGRQTHDFSFEIVIVLNHAERPLDVALPSSCRVFFCEKPGSFAARNFGILQARGRVLAFTDSDLVPHAKWLAEGYAAVETTSFNMLVAGAITLYHDRKTAAAVFDGAFYLQQESYALRRGFGASANLWVPACIIRQIGLFNENLFSASDVDLCIRAKEAGFNLIYSGDTIVYHPTRSRLSTLLVKERRLAGGGVLWRLPEGKHPTWYQLGIGSELRWFWRRARVITRMRPLSMSLRVQGVSLLVMATRIAERLLVAMGKSAERL